MSIVIAIDGPAGSGKGTVAKKLAEKLGFINIDTGATYRSVALKCLRLGINLDEKEKIIEVAKNIDISETVDGKVIMDGEDVSEEIRSKEVTSIVSQVSSIVEVRECMVSTQRRMASENNVVMEGRDITTVVFPNATYKFYLDASIDVRAKRRYDENLSKGINTSYEDVYENIKMRDYNDMHKECGSLIRCDDQIYVDSSNLSREEVLEKMLEYIQIN